MESNISSSCFCLSVGELCIYPIGWCTCANSFQHFKESSVDMFLSTTGLLAIWRIRKMLIVGLIVILVTWTSSHQIYTQTTTAMTKNEILAMINNKLIVDWKKTRVDQLSLQQMTDYLLWSNDSSCLMSQFFGGIMLSLVPGEIAGYDGQKAVCLDSTVAPKEDRCLVYSFGINNDWTFDEAMELYGCRVFSFDPSMNQPDHNHSRAIRFYRMALDSVNQNDWNQLKGVPSRTLSSIYQMLTIHHSADAVIDYLKIDIEGAEWNVLPHILQSGMMDKVRQLAVEIHLSKTSISDICRQIGVLQSLED